MYSISLKMYHYPDRWGAMTLPAHMPQDRWYYIQYMAIWFDTGGTLSSIVVNADETDATVQAAIIRMGPWVLIAIVTLSPQSDVSIPEIANCYHGITHDPLWHEGSTPCASRHAISSGSRTMQCLAAQTTF